MKKYKSWFIALLLILLIVIILWVVKIPLTASCLSRKLKTDVGISKVSIKSNKMIISGFKLKNHKKTKSKYAFKADKLQIYYSFSKYFSSPSIIDSISLKNVNLDIECDNSLCTKNNWTTIIDKVNEKEQKKEYKDLIIKNLVIKNMNVQIIGLGLDFNNVKTLHIAEIKFNNISSKNGFPTQQLIAAIFRSIGLKDYLKGVMETKPMFENIIDIYKDVSDNLDKNLDGNKKVSIFRCLPF